MNENKAIRYLSLAAKAGRIVTGGDEVEKSIRRGKGGLLIVASDAGRDTVRRGELLAGGCLVTLERSAFNKSQIAAAVGRGSSVAIALVTDEGLAEAYRTASASAQKQEEQT